MESTLIALLIMMIVPNTYMLNTPDTSFNSHNDGINIVVTLFYRQGN